MLKNTVQEKTSSNKLLLRKRKMQDKIICFKLTIFYSFFIYSESNELTNNLPKIKRKICKLIQRLKTFKLIHSRRMENEKGRESTDQLLKCHLKM